MIEETDFETYLYVSRNKFQIIVFNKLNKKNLYNEELILNEKFNFFDLTELSNFLNKNIYKIEKLIGNFIKNIFLVIKNDNNLCVSIGITKKNYDSSFKYNFLEYALTEIKDLFRESFPKEIIMHMLLENYIIDGKKHNSFKPSFVKDNLCLEVNFISISSYLTIIFDKLLEKYQIKVSQYLCGNYIEEYFGDVENDLSIKVNKLVNGFNEKEVILIPKIEKNKGFFEKFFQLFS